MSDSACPKRAVWRRVVLTLAVLALALKVLIPAGFMASAPSAGGGYPVVICTGHGAEVVDAQAAGQNAPARKSPEGKAPHDPPCAFAGYGVTAPASSVLAVSRVAFVAYRIPSGPSAHRDLSPGRGLSAPPLPARGPPEPTA